MIDIRVNAPSGAYTAHIGPGLLGRAGELAAAVLRPGRAAVVADDAVSLLYADGVLASLRAAGFDPVLATFPHGEKNKTAETLTGVLNALAQARLTRTDTVFALGGGVTGDVAGLAAALYMRGVALVQLPTTLLAAVDASVGGKTAVDLPAGKNLMGTFYQPKLVLCDTNALSTLPAAELANGCAEIVKTAFLSDAALLTAVTAEKPDWTDVIARCVRFKAGIVEADERDAGERQLLNFGHSFGHAIEKCADYAVPHGAAVAVGMCLTARAAFKKGLCGPECPQTLEKALAALGLPTKTGFGGQELFEALASDKKMAGDKLTLIVPRAVGRCERLSLPFSEARAFLALGLEACGQ